MVLLISPGEGIFVLSFGTFRGLIYLSYTRKKYIITQYNAKLRLVNGISKFFYRKLFTLILCPSAASAPLHPPSEGVWARVVQKNGTTARHRTSSRKRGAGRAPWHFATPADAVFLGTVLHALSDCYYRPLVMYEYRV